MGGYVVVMSGLVFRVVSSEFLVIRVVTSWLCVVMSGYEWYESMSGYEWL